MQRLGILLITALVITPINVWAKSQTDSNKAAAHSASSSKKVKQNSSKSDNNGSISASDEAIFKQLGQSQSAKSQVPDPLEPYNRWMFNINEHLDRWIAKPLAEFYVDIVPPPIQTMVNNAYSNLGYIPTVANDAMQANFYQFTSDSWRFVINTTIGLGGLFDPASHMGLPENHQTFGLTMAKWGWEQSTYFVIPVLGPSTIRDAAGKPVTLATSIYWFMDSPANEWGLYAGSLLNRRVQMLKFSGVMDQAALDKYTFLKNAYMQRQRYLIQQNDEHDIPYSAKQTQYFAQQDYLYR